MDFKEQLKQMARGAVKLEQEEMPSEDGLKKVNVKKLPLAYNNDLSDEELLCASLGNQIRHVFEYLLTLSRPWVNMHLADIMGERGVPVPYYTRRAALCTLADRGFITNRKRNNRGALRGMTFKLNKKLTTIYCKMYGLEIPTWL